jgi:hypothetical protein
MSIQITGLSSQPARRLPFYFVADAYYANGKTVRGLLANGNHLVTRVKSNSVAYFPAPPQPANRPRLRGRPTKYGNKILIAALLRQTDQLQQAPSPVYGEQGITLRFRSADLFWRPVGNRCGFQCRTGEAPPRGGHCSGYRPSRPESNQRCGSRPPDEARPTLCYRAPRHRFG